MDTLLLGLTVVSLIVALITSVTAWRLVREEKQRSAARIAALSAASFDSTESIATADAPSLRTPPAPVAAPVAERVTRAPWKAAAIEPVERDSEPAPSPSSSFFGSSQVQPASGSRQRGLAMATVVFFIVITGAFVWTMSRPEGTSAVAVGPNAPLELVSLSHARQNDPATGIKAGKLVVSGLVRNPAAGQAVEKLSAVVFLFDRMGTFVSSSRAHVDFLKLGAGDESPFVVSLDAPATVARYRVSFRTDEGVVPHVDRRGDSPVPAAGEQPVNVTLK